MEKQVNNNPLDNSKGCIYIDSQMIMIEIFLDAGF